jgi:antitoxin HicB
MRLRYPFTIEPDDDLFTLVLRDFPQVHDWGDTPEEVESRAVEAIEAGIAGAIKMRVQVPLPSAFEEGEKDAPLSTLIGMKVLLWNTMLSRGLSKSALARDMGVQPNQVDRIFDIDHNTSLEQLDRTASALGLFWDLGLDSLVGEALAPRVDHQIDTTAMARELALNVLAHDPDQDMSAFIRQAATNWNSTHGPDRSVNVYALMSGNKIVWSGITEDPDRRLPPNARLFIPKALRDSPK